MDRSRDENEVVGMTFEFEVQLIKQVVGVCQI
jgi:hypothetical protein